jgi:NADH dehydrogenase/NADH:ubiquinone oxidoreductase subunit G
VVEAFWGKRSKLVTACIYTAWQDERIETNNKRVRKARKAVLELLLARCPEVESIRKLAADYGIEEARFRPRPGEDRTERCILCGLCVRVCAEVVGQHAIGYANRGSERAITTPFGKQADECIGCGACVFVCPTGALTYEDVDGERIMTQLNTRVPLVACGVCGARFATEAQIERIRQRLKLPDDLAGMCPRCRGQEFRGAMEKCLTVLRE